MPFVGTIYGCQFLGPHAITLLGPTCEGSCWDHIRMEVLENTCNLISGTTGDIIAGEHVDVSSGDYMRFRFWEQRRILV